MTNIKLTWLEFDKAVSDLVGQLTIGNYLDKFDSIYGIPRGGLVLAVVLSHRLNKPLEVLESIEDPFLYPISSRILVVDDISDTGKTLLKLSPKLSATIHYNSSSRFRPTVWSLLKSDGNWIIYPWENSDTKYR